MSARGPPEGVIVQVRRTNDGKLTFGRIDPNTGARSKQVVFDTEMFVPACADLSGLQRLCRRWSRDGPWARVGLPRV